MKMRKHVMLLAGSLTVVIAANAANNDWPRFRGPTGDGLSPAKGIPATWSKDTNVLWTADLPKPLRHGRVTRKEMEDLPNAYNPWSSPIVSGDKVFVATAGVNPQEHKLLCFALADGKPLWEASIPPGPITNKGMRDLLANVDWVRTKGGPPLRDTHIANGYSICTPCTDGERVFVTFGSYVLTAVDFQGKIVWQKPLAGTSDNPPSGGHYASESGVTLGLCLGSSPIVYKDLVIQVCETSIKAFDCRTGDVKYETPMPFGERWATPILVALKGKTVLFDSNGGLRGIDPDNGNTLWTARSFGSYGSSPVYNAGFVYGYRGASNPSVFALAVSDGLTGDVAKDTRWTSTKRGWCTHGSPVCVDGTLYRYGSGFGLQGLVGGIPTVDRHGPVKDTSAFYSVDTATGTVTGSLPMPGVSNWTSPVATADGYVYLATGGRSYVVKAGPKPEIVGVNDLGDYNVGPSPAIADGKLIIRGGNKLWCIGKP